VSLAVNADGSFSQKYAAGTMQTGTGEQDLSLVVDSEGSSSEGAAEQHFKHVDADGDGMLSLTEFNGHYELSHKVAQEKTNDWKDTWISEALDECRGQVDGVEDADLRKRLNSILEDFIQAWTSYKELKLKHDDAPFDFMNEEGALPELPELPECEDLPSSAMCLRLKKVLTDVKDKSAEVQEAKLEPELANAILEYMKYNHCGEKAKAKRKGNGTTQSLEDQAYNSICQVERPGVIDDRQKRIAALLYDYDKSQDPSEVHDFMQKYPDDNSCSVNCVNASMCVTKEACLCSWVKNETHCNQIEPEDTTAKTKYLKEILTEVTTESMKDYCDKTCKEQDCGVLNVGKCKDPEEFADYVEKARSLGKCPTMKKKGERLPKWCKCGRR